MSSPITVGITAMIAIPKNRKRNTVKFQNVGSTTLYFVRQKSSTIVNVPSATNFEFALNLAAGAELNEAIYETNSTAQFNVVSTAAGGSLAIFETTGG